MNRRVCGELPDEGLVTFFPYDEADLPLGLYLFPFNFFPAIGVSAYVSSISLPDRRESVGLVIQLLPNDRDYPSPVDLA